MPISPSLSYLLLSYLSYHIYHSLFIIFMVLINYNHSSVISFLSGPNIQLPETKKHSVVVALLLLYSELKNLRASETLS